MKAHSWYSHTGAVRITPTAMQICSLRKKPLSPVSSPTVAAEYRLTRSLYFWLDSALIGVV